MESIVESLLIPKFSPFIVFLSINAKPLSSSYREDAEDYLKGMNEIGLILYDEERGFAFIERNAKNGENFGIKRDSTMDSIVYYLI